MLDSFSPSIRQFESLLCSTLLKLKVLVVPSHHAWPLVNFEVYFAEFQAPGHLVLVSRS